MSDPLLATKLHIPPLRAARVQRARLLASLEYGRQRKLTLVSAPAGFGKTTLVSEWVAQCGCPVAWWGEGQRVFAQGRPIGSPVQPPPYLPAVGNGVGDGITDGVTAQ